MQVFTLEVGFPLKFYELVTVVATASALLVWRLDPFDRWIFSLGAAFVVYLAAALVVRLELLEGAAPYSYLARFGPMSDGALKIGYVALCLLGFRVVALGAQKAPARLVSAWLGGAGASAAIHFLLLLCSAGNWLPHLPGMLPAPTGQQFSEIGALRLYRAGTFLEGNFAGPFFVLSFLLAVAARRRFFSALFLAATLASFSTNAIVGFAAAAIYIVAQGRKNLPLVAALALGFFAFAQTSVFEETMMKKFEEGAAQQTSYEERQRAFLQAWDLFERFPLAGVGISQFGSHVVGQRQWLLAGPGGLAGGIASAVVTREIPNNVYVEIASECGLIGLGLFAALMSSVFQLAFKCRSTPLRAGALSILVFWIASPTFTMFYYWGFLGVVCGLAKRAEADQLARPRFNRDERALAFERGVQAAGAFSRRDHEHRHEVGGLPACAVTRRGPSDPEKIIADPANPIYFSKAKTFADAPPRKCVLTPNMRGIALSNGKRELSALTAFPEADATARKNRAGEKQE